MKKTKKKGLFKKFGAFLDKRIVTPITRLIVKIAKGFENSEKFIENWLSKQNTLLFISLIVAIIVFVVIDQKIIVFTNQTAEVLKDQTVDVTYNEEAYVIEGLDRKSVV